MPNTPLPQRTRETRASARVVPGTTVTPDDLARVSHAEFCRDPAFRPVSVGSNTEVHLLCYALGSGEDTIMYLNQFPFLDRISAAEHWVTI